MLDTEYVKSMNCNYERIKLSERPEEKRYQYCIMSRGGIWGLLPFSLRMINGDTFFYYDISSKQNISQIYRKKTVDRQWIKDFIWNMNKIKQEISRFLLDDRNLMWYPEQIYQDLEDNRWSFLYYPYYQGDNGFKQLLEFVVEKMDYSDDLLVECVYKIYEQYERYGEIYLSERINKDIEILDVDNFEKDIINKNIVENELEEQKNDGNKSKEVMDREMPAMAKEQDIVKEPIGIGEMAKEKRGLLSFLEGAKKKEPKERFGKEKEQKNKNTAAGIKEKYPYLFTEESKVAEDTDYFEEEKQMLHHGKTVYIPIAKDKEIKKRLYDDDGRVLAVMNEEPIIIGKKSDEVDIIIEDPSISRVHARISFENGEYYLEDLNSTNSTVKNGMVMLPYEKRRLLGGDEIRLGNVTLHFE